MNRNRIITAMLVGLLSAAAFADPPATPTPTPTPADSSSGTSVRVFDSEDAYWLNKGFNDNMFQVNTGGFNEARAEQAHEMADKVIKRMHEQEPAPTMDIIYQGRHINDGLPFLRRGDGQAERLSPP